MSLKLADMLGSQLIGRAVEVLSEVRHCTDIRLCGLMGVITTLSCSLVREICGSLTHPDGDGDLWSRTGCRPDLTIGRFVSCTQGWRRIAELGLVPCVSLPAYNSC